VREILKRAYVGITGAPWGEAAGRRLFGRRLRVLAYHDVTGPAAFEVQMRHIRRNYAPVSLEDLLSSVEEDRPLPRRAVWVTFDDGHPGVTQHAMPILNRLGIKAAVFVCPGLIGTSEPFWWDVVRAAFDHGVSPSIGGRSRTDGPAVSAIKSLPDSARRSIVAELAGRLDELGIRVERRQLTVEDLLAWTRAGHDVGNHTWDHPLLDRCPVSEQRRQVEDADRWLRANLPEYRPSFAYPNGNWSAGAEAALQALGYRVALGFDHRLARPDRSFLRLSRLRVSADADLPRFRSIVSGLHSMPFSVVDLAPGARARRLRSPA
jgi:peptidoglycan/xylan/chitin deacetylase (PgdA/CDA1 family)